VMYTHFMRGDWERAIASDTDNLKWVTNWTLPLVGRQDEAIGGYRAQEVLALPGRIRDFMRGSRLALEGKREECLDVILSFAKASAFDPEGLYFIARTLVFLNEPAGALDMLDRVIERGFFCPTALLRDPWLDSVRGGSRFNQIVSRADARSRDAEVEFRRLGGERLLGMTG